eukprot:TRINITY_DN3469_c0_g2_i1.p1 TRINITY_DN3469_c0_g2~~TRINITY_DN3469_c0_g2_i1.p1  ORF type:complete len:323 (-),score=44.16 TRINITY_DN3469_c0_g2_i1:875-1843(-)
MERFLTPDHFTRYRRFSFSSTVKDISSMKFCPAPSCNYCIRVELYKTRALPVKCKCGFSFCFKCSDYDIGDHTPATCSDVERWLEKANNESENVMWMLSNCKRCPQCRKPIEKNGGCMHMTCNTKVGGCGHEFCWLCRGPWSTHGTETGGYYACNKYDASKSQMEDRDADFKTDLETYMFYFHRYESHHSAMKIADEQMKEAENKALIIMNTFSVPFQDTKFLSEVTQQLYANRRCLKYSYVYGYYLDPSKKTEGHLFEYLQEDLEKYTNSLSELYESDISQIYSYEEFTHWRARVLSLLGVTASFMHKFIQGVVGGLVSVS